MQDLKVTRDNAVGIYSTQLANSRKMSYDPYPYHPYGTLLPGYYPSHCYGYHLSPPYEEGYDAGYADNGSNSDPTSRDTLEEDGVPDFLMKCEYFLRILCETRPRS